MSCTTCICLCPKQHWQLVCTTCWNATPAGLRTAFEERTRAGKFGCPSWYAARNAVLKHAEKASVARRQAEREAAIR